jgi:mRNA-degrading endonuclease RelE of RelBE toxin-antitoxin system
LSRRLIWDRRALDDLHTLGRREQRLAHRIATAIERYAEDDQGDVRKLAGSADEYRLRVGDWRVVSAWKMVGTSWRSRAC